jgi:prefoldin subunit 5
MAKVGVQESVNKEKLETLHSQLEEVMGKREELTVEMNRITTIAVKLQGAIEVLEGMEEESDKKEEK